MSNNRAWGVTAFLEKKFDTYEFDGTWAASFGHPEKNFKACVFGDSGNGKTDFCIKFAKYLTRFGKVYYNSFEEGVSRTLQAALERNDMQEVKGKIIFGNRETFTEMKERMGRRNSPKFCFIDSRDFIELTENQFKELIQAHPKKSFIVTCWSTGSRPKGKHARAIEYISDIKIQVKNFKAYPRCRYGGNEDFMIWEEGYLREKRKSQKASTPTLFDTQ